MNRDVVRRTLANIEMTIDEKDLEALRDLIGMLCAENESLSLQVRTARAELMQIKYEASGATLMRVAY